MFMFITVGRVVGFIVLIQKPHNIHYIYLPKVKCELPMVSPNFYIEFNC